MIDGKPILQGDGGFSEPTRFQVIDLIRHPSGEWEKQFNVFLRQALESDQHPLMRNYVNMGEDYKKFLSFCLLVDRQQQNRIVMFTGLHCPPHYPQTTARAFTRHYLDPAYRMSRGGVWLLGSRWILPYMVEVAREAKLESVFWSMENPTRRKKLAQLIKAQNRIGQGLWTFELLEDLYNTCPPIKGSGLVNSSACCWQSIAFCPLAFGARLELPTLSVSQWFDQFS